MNANNKSNTISFSITFLDVTVEEFREASKELLGHVLQYGELCDLDISVAERKV